MCMFVKKTTFGKDVVAATESEIFYDYNTTQPAHSSHQTATEASSLTDEE